MMLRCLLPRSIGRMSDKRCGRERTAQGAIKPVGDWPRCSTRRQQRRALCKPSQAARAPGDDALAPKVHVNLGITLEADGRLLAAAEHYGAATAACPGHFRARKLLGSALYALGDLAAARAELDFAVALQPGYADAHCDLGAPQASPGARARAAGLPRAARPAAVALGSTVCTAAPASAGRGRRHCRQQSLRSTRAWVLRMRASRDRAEGSAHPQTPPSAASGGAGA
jgi:tetratricopeptide (TPR) repeat protein